MNMSCASALPRKMAELIAKQDHFDRPGTLLSWEDETNRRLYSVVQPCGVDESAHLVFTLPTITSNIYVTVSEGDPALVRQVLGTIENVELASGVLPGNVLLLDDARLKARGIHGVIFLGHDLFICLDKLPDSIQCEGETYHILTVAFLDEKEHRIWKEQGHDALMDHWDCIDKDLIAFGTSAVL